MRKSKFIVIEGIDGSGKTTQIKNIVEKLKQENYSVIHTFEPTNSIIGKIIRDVFSSKIQMDPHTIAALFLADRLEHILNKENGLLKLLNDYDFIICDRYYFSSFAYHSIDVDGDWVVDCNRKCMELLKPDINIFIDVEPEICIQRINQRNSNLEIFETLENLQKAKNNYIKYFNLFENQENIVLINGNDQPEIITKKILDLIKK